MKKNNTAVLKNIINRLVIDLKINKLIVSSYAEYIDEQTAVVESIKQIIEDCLKEKFVDGPTMLIGKLDIDVRGKSVDEILQNVKDELTLALENLNYEYAQKLVFEDKYRETGIGLDVSESYNVNSSNTNNTEEINLISSYITDLLYFIEFGVFKWLSTSRILANDKLLQEVFSNLLENQLTTLSRIISNSVESSKRILFNLPLPLLVDFYKRLIINKTPTGLPVSDVSEFFKLAKRAQGMDSAVEVSALIIVEACRETQQAGYKVNSEIVITALKKWEKLKPASKVLQLIKRTSKLLELTKGKTKDNRVDGGTIRGKKISAEDKVEVWNGKLSKLSVPEGTGKYIENAGMVIMLPYLPQFFAELKYVKNGSFINENKQKKACLILEYLVTGAMRFNEAELVLNKLACGVELEAAIPVRLWLTPKQKLLCREFLTAIRDEWTALKNTSVEYMCYTFFQRNGIIEKVDDGWRIKVEYKDLDILVESIPWGFRTIRQPWNNYMIFTEWG